MMSEQGVAVAIVSIAAGWDLAARRIPNLLTFGAALAGVVFHAYLAGWSGAGAALAGWLAGAALFFPIFALGGMGAGDVKLLAAIGAWLGPAAVVWVGLFSAIAGGVMAVVLAMWSGYLRQACTNLWSLLTLWRLTGIRPAPELMLSTARGPRLAYAVPVLAGLMAALWYQSGR